MKKSVYKPGTLLLAGLFLLSFQLNAQDELTKEFHKEYKASKNAMLDLNNRYGRVIVETS